MSGVYSLYMNGYTANIEKETLENDYFRKVLYTDPRLQLVVMTLKPLEDIGEETHDLDQFIRVESGTGKAILDGVEYPVADGSAVIVPQGTRHNIVNTSAEAPMRLYTIYAPADHRPGTVHATKADALADTDDHFA